MGAKALGSARRQNRRVLMPSSASRVDAKARMASCFNMSATLLGLPAGAGSQPTLPTLLRAQKPPDFARALSNWQVPAEDFRERRAVRRRRVPVDPDWLR